MGRPRTYANAQLSHQADLARRRASYRRKKKETGKKPQLVKKTSQPTSREDDDVYIPVFYETPVVTQHNTKEVVIKANDRIFKRCVCVF
jgi:hypothetical protein